MKSGKRWGRIASVVLVLALGGVAAFVVARSRSRADAAKFTSREEVLRRADEAEQRGDRIATFELLDRGLERYPSDAEMTRRFSMAANNVCYAVRGIRGRMVPVLATSRARHAAAQRVLAALDRWERLQSDDPETYYYRGQLYASWGFPHDALIQLFRAHQLGDSSLSLERTAREIVQLESNRINRAAP